MPQSLTVKTIYLHNNWFFFVLPDSIETCSPSSLQLHIQLERVGTCGHRNLQLFHYVWHAEINTHTDKAGAKCSQLSPEDFRNAKFVGLLNLCYFIHLPAEVN